MTREIDIPFADKSYEFTGWVNYFIFMHILPHMFKPKSKESIVEFALPISLFIQSELLDSEFEGEKQRTKIKIDILEKHKFKDMNTPRAYYSCEREFYEKIGGDEALLEAYTMREVREFIKNKALSIMAIHSMIKVYIEMCEKYELDKSRAEPSFAKCFEFFSNNPQGYPYQTLAEKGLEEGAWREFKCSCHLIYGYVEGLMQKGLIPKTPQGNAEIFIKTTISNILIDFDKNYDCLKTIMSHAMIAQNFLQKYQHSKSSHSINIWQLPKNFEKQFRLKLK